MGRNKYPEQTRAAVLKAAGHLFVTRGYEATSLQDVADVLGMTKGAVYQHFTSKDDLFWAAMDSLAASTARRQADIVADEGLTGAEKLQALFDGALVEPMLASFSDALPLVDPVKNARLLGLQFKEAACEAAHAVILPVVEQGVRDGSIRTDSPVELAEVLALLGNLWLVPLFDPAEDADAMRRRVDYFARLAGLLGAPLRPGSMREALVRVNDLALRARRERADGAGGNGAPV